MSTHISPVILALDYDNVNDALQLVQSVGDAASFYKVGLELYSIGGMALVDRLGEMGKKVFLDLKLYDIPQTVMRATRQICSHGAVVFLTVHASPSLMRAAVEGRGNGNCKLLGVTVLTSFGESDLVEMGYGLPMKDLVELRVQQAVAAKFDGVICSPLEARRAREISGRDFLIVTPGIRSEGEATGDQKRFATPAQALGNGASHLVVGRQVTRAANPSAAFAALQEEIQQAV
jgi:orotidine-5'-phosphate decarboxylase